MGANKGVVKPLKCGDSGATLPDQGTCYACMMPHTSASRRSQRQKRLGFSTEDKIKSRTREEKRRETTYKTSSQQQINNAQQLRKTKTSASHCKLVREPGLFANQLIELSKSAAAAGSILNFT